MFYENYKKKEEKEMDGNNIDNIITEIFSTSVRDSYLQIQTAWCIPAFMDKQKPTHSQIVLKILQNLENDWRTGDP